MFFGYSDRELFDKGGYDLVHTDDLSYYAAAHQELIKTGTSGLIAYRLLTKDFRWVWLQTSSKVIYKNSKPDFVICTHRHLTEDEGRDLARKRGNEFKLPYAIVDNDPSGFSIATEDDENKIKSSRNKKSKTQLRDYLQAGRKRKTPYRELYHSLNPMYASYSGINGYNEYHQAMAELKPDSFVYPYTGQNFSIETDAYRFGYQTLPSGAVYVPQSSSGPTTDAIRFDSDRYNCYSNGYYVDARQYPYSFQCHANNYSETSKYNYNNITKGYCSYGLDLSSKHDIPRYIETDYVGGEKLSLNNGMTFDPLTNSKRLLSCNMATICSCNSCDNLLSSSCSMLHNSNSLSSVYHQTATEFPSFVDRYIQTNTSSSADLQDSSNKSISNVDSSQGQCSEGGENNQNDMTVVVNGHCTVICRNSPMIAKSAVDKERTDETLSFKTNLSSWPSSSKSATVQCNHSNPYLKDVSDSSRSPLAIERSASVFSQAHNHGQDEQNNKITTAAAAPREPSSNSSAFVGMATSVIQMSGRAIRNYDKESVLRMSGGTGIAVPVVKSSWLYSAGTTSSWHPLPSLSDSTLPSNPLPSPPPFRPPLSESHEDLPSLNGCSSHVNSIMTSQIPKIMETKFLLDKVGDDMVDQSNNPLLYFSKMTHMLLNSSRQ